MRIVEDLDSRSTGLVTTPTAFAKSSLLHVQYIGHYYTNSGYSVERANLDSMLLAVTLNGEGELQYRGKPYRLCRGTVFLIDCRDYHLYRTDPENLWEFAWVHFTGKTSADYAEHFMRQGGPVIPVEDSAAMAEKIKDIYELQRNMDERSDIVSSFRIVELLTDLLLSAMGQGREERSPAYILQVKQALEQRLNSSFSLDELTQEFAISKFHLSREFKKHTGYSPYEYLVNQRMRTAKKLLKTSDLSVEEITRRVGFASATHFIHMFRKRERTTPLQFRKAWQGQ